MDKKRIYAVLMKEMYGVLVFALGGSLFYYLATGQKRALWITCAVFVLYSIWHVWEFRREQKEKAESAEDRYHCLISPPPVNDFAVPRYVYENGEECKKHNPKNGRIIGYRIGPDLVIAAQVVGKHKGWKRDEIEPYRKLYGGSLLNHDEANVLRRYWDIVSEMREAVGEEQLPLPYFWYQGEYAIEAAHYREDFDEIDPSTCAIILKL